MVQPDGNNIHSLRAFFESNKFLTTPELAIMAGRSMETIRNWRKRLGIPNKPRALVGKQPTRREVEFVGQDGLKDPVWLRKKYEEERMGIRLIARAIGTRHVRVLEKLKLYGIPIRPQSESVCTRHSCCTRDWLDQHYVVEELTLHRCAALAEVSPHTISRWLVKFGIPIRDRREAHTGHRNPFYGKKHTPEFCQKMREARQRTA